MTTVLLLAIATTAVIAITPVQYPLTVKALQERYTDEIIAHAKYSYYARQADRENYPYIAHLFRSLAASETVHARNFRKLLTELGHKPAMPAIPEFKGTRTSHNIHEATTVEAEEIDKEYPAILKLISSEKHKDAVRFITYAWKAEKQHRDLILKIKKTSKRFFGLLAGHIEGRPTRYYVCQVCGSMLVKRPQKLCPICKHAASHYTEVPGFPGITKEDED